MGSHTSPVEPRDAIRGGYRGMRGCIDPLSICKSSRPTDLFRTLMGEIAGESDCLSGTVRESIPLSGASPQDPPPGVLP